MTPEDGHTAGQAEQEQLEEITLPELTQAFLGSEHFRQDYSANTQWIYSQDVKRFLEFTRTSNIPDTDSAVQALNEYQQKRRVNKHGISAIRQMVKWGIKVGLIDKDTLERRSADPEALTPENLRDLLCKASVRDKALISTILVTRAPSDILKSLTTGNIKINEERRMAIEIGEQTITVLPELAVHINNHLKTIPIGPLFPNKKRGTHGISRQRMDQRFKTLKDELHLNQLNYSALVLTGEAMFGVLTYPKPQSRSS